MGLWINIIYLKYLQSFWLLFFFFQTVIFSYKYIFYKLLLILTFCTLSNKILLLIDLLQSISRLLLDLNIEFFKFFLLFSFSSLSNKIFLFYDLLVLVPYVFLVVKILTFIIIIVLILISVAFFTLLERKKLGSFHNRLGPNKVGFLGLLQAVADGIKLFLKESILPQNSNFFIFILSPLLAFFFGFAGWAIIPFSYTSVLADLNYGILYVFIISIFHIYGVILAGWSSNSRYSFLGALRSSAQLISYDISMGLLLLNIFLCTKSLNFLKIIEFQDFNGWFVFYFPIPFLLFLVCSLAETNRHPFDLPEAEAELVSGYNVEYSAMGFALFFLGEYSAILFTSILIVNLFLGGWLPIFPFLSFIPGFIWFLLKISTINFFFLIIRAAIPRYRYDQLMRIGWKFILPLSLSIFLLNFFIFFMNSGFLNDFSHFTKLIII